MSWNLSASHCLIFLSFPAVKNRWVLGTNCRNMTLEGERKTYPFIRLTKNNGQGNKNMFNGKLRPWIKTVKKCSLSGPKAWKCDHHHNVPQCILGPYLSSWANRERWQSPKSSPQILTLRSAEPVTISALSWRSGDHKEASKTRQKFFKRILSMRYNWSTTVMKNKH